MSPELIQEPIPAPVVNQGPEERWTAWQERGAADARATKLKLFIMAALLVLSVAILTGLSLLR
jgi:hypothetical protein